jgi:hypothetical protein
MVWYSVKAQGRNAPIYGAYGVEHLEQWKRVSNPPLGMDGCTSSLHELALCKSTRMFRLRTQMDYDKNRYYSQYIRKNYFVPYLSVAIPLIHEARTEIL